MSAVRLRRRPTLIGAAVATLTTVVVVVLALAPRYVQEATLRAPAQTSVAVLQPGREVCVSPAYAATPTDAIAVWGGPVLSNARVDVTASTLTGSPVLADGRFTASSAREYVARLSAQVAANRHFRVCVRAAFNAFSVLGTPPNPSLALLHRVSGLAALRLAFDRASLFRPSWVGSWTFWVLALAFLAAFGVAVAAVARATAEDSSAEL